MKSDREFNAGIDCIMGTSLDAKIFLKKYILEDQGFKNLSQKCKIMVVVKFSYDIILSFIS